MHYLSHFKKLINENDYPNLLSVWEEYCHGDDIDPEEFKRILQTLKNSTFAESFGRHVEQGLVIWRLLKNPSLAHDVFKLIIDLQTANNKELGEMVLDYLTERYGTDPLFQQKIRLVGLREMHNFQGAVSHFELLNHLKKGHFAFHTAGWGIGEIMEVSFLREQVNLEFDYVGGRKDVSFENAFKTLIPVPDDHFLARRFGAPDVFEAFAREHQVETLKILLRDLGPKSAQEIKDELCELVIPEDEWAKWWQAARTKAKKDTKISIPEDVRGLFSLREEEESHEDRLYKALEEGLDPSALIQLIYSFLRDFPATLKKKEFRQSLYDRLLETLKEAELTDAQELQIHFLLEDLSPDNTHPTLQEFVRKLPSVEDIIQKIDVIAFRKRALTEVRKERSDWVPIFLSLMLVLEQAPIRDYIFDELVKSGEKEKVSQLLHDKLIVEPEKHTAATLWYIKNALESEGKIPFSDHQGQAQLLESLLVGLAYLDNDIAGNRDLIKKIYQFITSGRYANIRKIFQHASIEAIKEFLLLASKSHAIDEHEMKIFHSLAEVVYPSLSKLRKGDEQEEEVIWSTEEGYQKLKRRIEQIATVETVENAREIEVARSHGDLRENAEFKAALEKRSRLQNELKTLSEQLKKMRVLLKHEISTEAVQVGVVVDCLSNKGALVSYTLLGPWDADPDKNILSFQSKLAQEMAGLKVGDLFRVQSTEYTIKQIRNYFE